MPWCLFNDVPRWAVPSAHHPSVPALGGPGPSPPCPVFIMDEPRVTQLHFWLLLRPPDPLSKAPAPLELFSLADGEREQQPWAHLPSPRPEHQPALLPHSPHPWVPHRPRSKPHSGVKGCGMSHSLRIQRAREPGWLCPAGPCRPQGIPQRRGTDPVSPAGTSGAPRSLPVPGGAALVINSSLRRLCGALRAPRALGSRGN